MSFMSVAESSTPKIAKICKCASCTINTWLKKHGIKVRNRNEAQRGEMAYWWGKIPSKQIKEKISKSMARYQANSLKPELYHNKKWLYQMYIERKLSSQRLAEVSNSYAAKIWYWIKKFERYLKRDKLIQIC